MVADNSAKTIPVGSFGMYEASRNLVVCVWDIRLDQDSTGSLLSLSRMDSRKCSMAATLQRSFYVLFLNMSLPKVCNASILHGM